MAVSLMRLGLAAVIVHTILFVSIFDIYFTSPVDQGMIPQFYTMSPPAKRLVLFVADGLRADTVFSLNADNSLSPAPFIRKVINEKGRWGISHTRVPTESRPGHVALIAGLYEDVSAVTKGWQENPVQFDSLFNQSAHTWSWGSPDILPMFAQGASPGKVDTFMYDAEWEDFADSDASKLDLWVFERVRELFERAKTDDGLASQLAQEKIVFFLHLLGIDTNGHAHRPTSREVIENLKIVDRGVRAISEMINTYYGDEKTSFVFTSDHGMTDWGSHGAGLPEETMTPLVCWGSGIKTPRHNSLAEYVYHDGWSEKWHLQKLERIDVEQADITVLMSVLIGTAIPINSEGVLPIGYIHYNKQFSAESFFSNARQLAEQLRIKEERISSTSLPYSFRPYHKISKSEIIERRLKIDKLIKEKQHQLALELSKQLIDIFKEGIRYYHTYHRLWLYLVITSGFLGWIVCIVLTILDLNVQTVQSFHQQHKDTLFQLPVAPFTLALVTVLLLMYQASPLLYYLYYLLPIVCWTYSWRQRAVIWNAWKTFFQKPAKLFKAVVALVFILCGLELLVVSFFVRSVLSVLLCVVSLWPYLTELMPKQLLLCLSWTFTCLLMALFPLLPVVGRNANYVLVAIPGALVTILTFVLFSLPDLKHNLCTPSKTRLPSALHLFNIQSVLLALSSFIPSITNWFFVQKEAIPMMVSGFSWFCLLFAIVAPNFGPRSLLGRLLHVSLSLYTVFLLLSTSFEAIFVLFLCILLCLWLVMEDILASTDSKTLIWESVISFSFPRVVTLVPTEHTAGKERVTVEDLRRVFFVIFFGVLSFFGLGNVASVNTFDPATVYCFLTVFSPFVMGALILWKMTIPFIFVSCVFNSITSVLNRSLKASLLVMLIMSDIMGLNFFFLVRDSGSWLDIGVSISHYVIIMTMIIGIVLLVGVARLLTGVTVMPRKVEDHTS